MLKIYELVLWQHYKPITKPCDDPDMFMMVIRVINNICDEEE